MYSWVVIAIVAYFLFAINGIADKFLLTRAVKHPAVYAFYIGASGPLVLVLGPFGLTFPAWPVLGVALLSGAAFILALLFFYTAIQRTSISRVLPLEGGLVPLFTLLFAHAIVGETLTASQAFAFIFLVVGAVLVSLKKEHGRWHPKALLTALCAALFFALSFVLSKYVYNQPDVTFVSGLIWTRLGLFVAALCLLLPQVYRHNILHAPHSISEGNALLFYGAQGVGALAGLFQNYAIALGTVSIVNALQGTQFAFTLLVTSLLSMYFPAVIKERINQSTILQKILAFILISLGLWLLGK